MYSTQLCYRKLHQCFHPGLLLLLSGTTRPVCCGDIFFPFCDGGFNGAPWQQSEAVSAVRKGPGLKHKQAEESRLHHIT